MSKSSWSPSSRRARRVGVFEAFGLRPLGAALSQGLRAVAGTPYVPANLWGPSSLKIFKPRISLPTWLGRKRADRRVPIYNFVNRVPQPRHEGYSVRVTYARDYRGGDITYDGHIGTDFAVPVGTPVVAPAPGVVLLVFNEMDRGGLKVCIDHGEGLFTSANHLARALVSVGERVHRGQTIGLSGASGMEFVLFFPWVAPHVHFNAVLNGEPVDPFAAEGEESLWRSHNDPVPFDGTPDPSDAWFEASVFDPDGVDAALAACRDPAVRAALRAIEPLPSRAAAVLVQRNYRPPMFEAFPELYLRRYQRRPRLDLMFRAEDFCGIAYPD